MNKLNCEECTKTNNHCCKADIPLDHFVGMMMFIEGKRILNKDLAITEHPRTEGKLLIIDKSWIKDKNIDLDNKDCVFLVDGKCSIYDIRPDICRMYGTEYIRCRWEASNITPEQIKRATFDDIRFYDDIANEKSLIFSELNKGNK